VKIAVPPRPRPRFSGNFARTSSTARTTAPPRPRSSPPCAKGTTPSVSVRDHLQNCRPGSTWPSTWSTRAEQRLASAAPPALLDVFGIPYTGGDFLSLAITLDKALAKEILGYHGVRTPAFQVFSAADAPLREGLGYPLIVKPLCEDASIGVCRDSVA
jgi:D-alanine-D-alanine ligase